MRDGCSGLVLIEYVFFSPRLRTWNRNRGTIARKKPDTYVHWRLIPKMGLLREYYLPEMRRRWLRSKSTSGPWGKHMATGVFHASRVWKST